MVKKLAVSPPRPNSSLDSDSVTARIAKSVLQTGMSVSGYIERITKEENDVYKLVVLVEMEGQ